MPVTGRSLLFRASALKFRLGTAPPVTVYTRGPIKGYI